MRELSSLDGSEGYAIRDDEVNMGNDGYVAKIVVLHIVSSSM